MLVFAIVGGIVTTIGIFAFADGKGGCIFPICMGFIVTINMPLVYKIFFAASNAVEAIASGAEPELMNISLAYIATIIALDVLVVIICVILKRKIEEGANE